MPLQEILDKIEALQASRDFNYKDHADIRDEILILDKFISKSQQSILELKKEIELMKMCLDYEKVASVKQIGSKKKIVKPKTKGKK